MGEWQEWKPILKRIGRPIRKVVSQYVEKVEMELEKKEKPAPGKTYTCKQCRATFSRTTDLASHVRYKHPKQ